MHGLGKHSDDLSAADATIALKVSLTRFLDLLQHNGRLYASPRPHQALVTSAHVTSTNNVRNSKTGR
jgi:hypothetical protein